MRSLFYNFLTAISLTQLRANKFGLQVFQKKVRLTSQLPSPKLCVATSLYETLCCKFSEQNFVFTTFPCVLQLRLTSYLCHTSSSNFRLQNFVLQISRAKDGHTAFSWIISSYNIPIKHFSLQLSHGNPSTKLQLTSPLDMVVGQAKHLLEGKTHARQCKLDKKSVLYITRVSVWNREHNPVFSLKLWT